MKWITRLWVVAAAVVAFMQSARSAPRRVAPPVEPEVESVEPGWKGFFADFKAEVKEDRLTVIAGSLAYYAFLALIPALIALVSFYGLAFDTADVERQIQDIADVLPDEAEELILTQLSAVVEGNPAGLGVGLAVSILAALWSASAGVKALIATINLVFDEDETRGFLMVRGLSLLFTLGALLFAAVGLGALVLLPRVLPLSAVGGTVLSVAIWPVVVAVMAVGLAVLYRWGPAHTEPSWSWVWGGAFGAAAAWALLTVLFGLYASTFGSFSATYGALAGVIVLLLWFYLSGLVILLGAEASAVHQHRQLRLGST